MSSVKQHLAILQKLQSATPKIRSQILLKSNFKLIKTILECIHNTLIGNVPLKKTEKSKLNKYKNVLRRLKKCKKGLQHVKTTIVQNGGFLPALLAPVIGAVITHILAR